MTTTTITQLSQAAIEISAALALLPGGDEISTSRLSVGSNAPFGDAITASLYPVTDYSNRLAAVRDVARWASVLHVDEVTISLSYGTGAVEAKAEVAGYEVSVYASIGTEHAYQLGTLLGRPLEEKQRSIAVSAEELIAACENAASAVA